ncbi:MAG: NINE protein [Candidatus Saccharimonadales bacterium]
MNPDTQPIVGDMEPTNQQAHEVPDWQKNIVPGAPSQEPVQQQAVASVQQAPMQEQPVQQNYQPVVPIIPVAQGITQAGDAPVSQTGSKNYVVTLILASLFGYYGVDRFYLGKYFTAILKLLTWGGLGVWVLIDIYRTGNGKVTAKDGAALDEYDKYGHIGRPVSKAFVIIAFVTLIIFGLLFILMTVVPLLFTSGMNSPTVDTTSQSQVETSTDLLNDTSTN